MENKDIKSFNVKDGSVHEFFKKYAVIKPDPHLDRAYPEDFNPYRLMADKILVKKSIVNEVKNECTLVIELFDEGRFSGKKLINEYTYAIEPYDDISLQLELMDFKVIIRK